MNVIFVNYNDFSSPSGMHIFHLANALEECGVPCASYSYGEAESVNLYGRPAFRSFDMQLMPEELLEKLDFARGETIVHCWTPREVSRIASLILAQKIGAPLVVHMEDNEDEIAKAILENVLRQVDDKTDLWSPGKPMFIWSHPKRYRAFLSAARGYTCIIDSLLEFKPPHVPGHVIWPSCEAEVFDIPPASSAEEKARWGIDPECKVIFYPGNMHHNNQKDLFALYQAVMLLRNAGLLFTLITYGNYSISRDESFADEDPVKIFVNLKDKIAPSQVPEVMRAADFLVQPGEDTAFNKYRFPCKLPLFMASGRPVILGRTNLGKYLTNGLNCLLLENSSAEEIAAHLRRLADNPAEAGAIGEAGREYAREHFSWSKAALKLRGFYEEALGAFNI